MKTMKLRHALAGLSLLPLALFAADNPKNCGCACCKGKEVCCCHAGEATAPNAKADSAPNAKPAETARHPLKGVVVEVRTERGALLVKHEAIPGYMMAMTMLFKVDAATLKAVKTGAAITGTLVERGDDYYLEDVKPVAP